jgi:hypothetical protein
MEGKTRSREEEEAEEKEEQQQQQQQQQKKFMEIGGGSVQRNRLFFEVSFLHLFSMSCS